MTYNNTLFRSGIQRLIPHSWIILYMIFFMHAFVRFGGLSNPFLIPVSMMIIWPLPWLLSTKNARKEMGFNGTQLWWYTAGPLVTLAVLFVTAGVTWWIFGDTDSNWFVRHASALDNSLSSLPENTSPGIKFFIVTTPAMIFSPLGEEFLFRGYLLTALSATLNRSAAILIQAAAFAFCIWLITGYNLFSQS